MKTLKIVKIEQIKNNSLRYDIETKNTHSFFANGILVHNSNFSIWYDDNEIKFSKRTAFIKDDTSFFLWQLAIERGDFKNKIKELYKSTGATDCIILYGELCGGIYPHKDVDSIDNKGVQKGVFYSPDQRFVPFDLKVDGIYLNIADFLLQMKEHNIIHVPVIALDISLTEALKIEKEQPSILYDKYGLPKIENNVAEGVVIKPMQNLYMGNTRIIIKNKNKAFLEKSCRTAKRHKPIEFEDNEQEFLNKLCWYLNSNRIRSSISKIGTITQKDFSKLSGMVSGDCVKDFVKDYPDFCDIEKKDRKKITNYFMKNIVATKIRTNFLNIIDGVF